MIGKKWIDFISRFDLFIDSFASVRFLNRAAFSACKPQTSNLKFREQFDVINVTPVKRNGDETAMVFQHYHVSSVWCTHTQAKSSSPFLRTKYWRWPANAWHLARPAVHAKKVWLVNNQNQSISGHNVHRARYGGVDETAIDVVGLAKLWMSLRDWSSKLTIGKATFGIISVAWLGPSVNSSKCVEVASEDMVKMISQIWKESFGKLLQKKQQLSHVEQT